MRDAAVLTDFYRDWTAAWPDDQALVERFLDQHVERGAAQALKLVASGELPESNQLHSDLARFLAFQLVRTPSFRRLDHEIGSQLHPVLLAIEVVKRVKAEKPEAPIEELEHVLVRARRLFADAAKGLGTRSDPRSALRIMLRKADELHQRFNELELLLLSAEEPVLLTSDAPVVVWTPGKLSNDYEGLLPDGSEILLPITPRRLLIATPSPQLGVATLTREMADQTNALLAVSCERYLYRHPDTPWPVGLCLSPTLSPLQAPTVTLRPGTGRESFPATYPDIADPLIAQLLADLGGTDLVE